MDARVALLSNVNITPICKELESRNVHVWEPTGYGDVLGALLNPSSGFDEFSPTDTFVLIDLSHLLQFCSSIEECDSEMDAWFSTFEAQIQERGRFYISDGVCETAPFFSDRKSVSASLVESHWNEKLKNVVDSKSTAYIFPYSEIVKSIGYRESFSKQLWYLARIPYTAKLQSAIVAEMDGILTSISTPAKKVLAIDLDNTIWGGVVGETGPLGVELSDEHLGLAYKDVQRVIKKMVNAGVVLCVISKNNFDDAIEVFKTNPSMVLKESDIACFKANWNRKDQNLAEIAKELNLGIDSFVFLDDSPTERALVSEMHPSVEVIDFPSDVTELPSILRDVYEKSFKQLVLTEEDRVKTKQYLANAERAQLELQSDNFADYLNGLDIYIEPVDIDEHIERIAQLVGKTNQFNLTTKRYSQAEIEAMAHNPKFEVYAFNVSDRFGDNGLTAVLIIDLNSTPVIDTFLMSCRIMGREIEVALIDYIESLLQSRGFDMVDGLYSPTPKNKPVEHLYESLGYSPVECEEGESRFRMYLNERPHRYLYAKGLCDE